jgi:hypothetical protein
LTFLLWPLQEQQAMAVKSSKEKESAAAETLRMQRDTRQFEEQRNRLKEKELEKQVIREKIEKLKQTEFGMRVLKELEVFCLCLKGFMSKRAKKNIL